MRFSVMIAVYNAEKYLEETIQCVLAQTCTDFELILIDDGSTDGSDRICDKFAEQDRRVRVFHTENRGVFKARAYAETKARGEYLLHFDADDRIENTLLQTLFERIDASQPDLICYNFSTFRPGEEYKEELFFEEERIFEGEARSEMYALMLSTRFNTLCNKCFSRKLVESAPDYNRFPELKHGEDLLRSGHLVFSAEKILYIPKSFYFYRLGIGNASHFDPESIVNYGNVVDELQKLLYKNDTASPEWDARISDLCRKILDNYLRLMISGKVSVSRGAALLKKYSALPIFVSAVSASDAFKYKLLRKKLYRTLLLIYRARRVLHA